MLLSRLDSTVNLESCRKLLGAKREVKPTVGQFTFHIVFNNFDGAIAVPLLMTIENRSLSRDFSCQFHSLEKVFQVEREILDQLLL